MNDEAWAIRSMVGKYQSLYRIRAATGSSQCRVWSSEECGRLHWPLSEGSRTLLPYFTAGSWSQFQACHFVGQYTVHVIIYTYSIDKNTHPSVPAISSTGEAPLISWDFFPLLLAECQHGLSLQGRANHVSAMPGPWQRIDSSTAVLSQTNRQPDRATHSDMLARSRQTRELQLCFSYLVCLNQWNIWRSSVLIFFLC